MGQVVEQGVRQSQVALGVFKINRVDFVRHSGRSHFTLDSALLEITQGNVAPDVAIEINQYGVEPCQGIKKFCHVIVGFNLGRVGIPA